MPNLFGRDYSLAALRGMTSSIDQLAGIRLYQLDDGRARGMRVAEVYTGSGLRFQVFLDRAMDIGAAEFAGKPMAWVHPALGGPALYEPEGYAWGRTWGGGLLTTCGLTFFGQPENDGGEQLGLHGRIAHLAAEHIAVTTKWRGDDYVLEISGRTRQAVLGGENMLLERRISTQLGATSFVIEDTVRNEALRPTPHMLLYHCNFGFPVVSPASQLLISDETVTPRDAAAAAGLADHQRFDEPNDPNYPEQVFFHKPRVQADGTVSAAIVNREIEFGAYVSYRAAELPFMAQWKQMSLGDYVSALEPCTVWEAPRQKLREEGRLRSLQPGEEVHYRLELGPLPDAAAIARFEQTIATR